jgi:hypothetical protein
MKVKKADLRRKDSKNRSSFEIFMHFIKTTFIFLKIAKTTDFRIFLIKYLSHTYASITDTYFWVGFQTIILLMTWFVLTIIIET